MAASLGATWHPVGAPFPVGGWSVFHEDRTPEVSPLCCMTLKLVPGSARPEGKGFTPAGHLAAPCPWPWWPVLLSRLKTPRRMISHAFFSRPCSLSGLQECRWRQQPQTLPFQIRAGPGEVRPSLEACCPGRPSSEGHFPVFITFSPLPGALCPSPQSHRGGASSSSLSRLPPKRLRGRISESHHLREAEPECSRPCGAPEGTHTAMCHE